MRRWGESGGVGEEGRERVRRWRGGGVEGA